MLRLPAETFPSSRSAHRGVRLLAGLGLICLLLVSSGCNSADADRSPSAGASDAPVADERPDAAPRPGAVAPKAEVAASGEAAAPASQSDPSRAAEPPAADSPRVPPTDGPRVYAKTRNVWIRARPTTDTQWIGFLWWGDSLRLRSTAAVSGPGCDTWYAVEPQGYVCVDGKRATLDPEDPVVRGTFPYAHNSDNANPHPHYGETRGAYRYVRLPTEKTQRAKEWDYRFRMAWLQQARAGEPRHEELLGVDLSPASDDELLLPELPSTLQMAHRKLIPRSTVAWSTEVQHEGRTFLLTDDLSWVPKDRVVPYPEITYHGVHLSAELQLPLALVRKRDIPAYMVTDGTATPTDKTYPRLGWVKLTGQSAAFDKRTYWETQAGDWVAEDEAVVPHPRAKTPWGAATFQSDTTGKAPEGRQTWIQVSILGGWLIAYEGTKPVFVTLMSPGKGGPPHGNQPTLETASTPTGWFKITGKFVTSTMIAPNDLVHSAVPWAQNFSGPYAIHGAYWHNDWGELKSGGCINLSPEDARFMFEFTEPSVPPGWHGVRWLPNEGPSTALLIGR